MFRHFERGSSDIDWCESNYIVSSSVAEFSNTVSSIYFILFPPLLMCLFKPYASHATSAIHLIWGLLIVVGISSAYFHATLSMVGQLLDELAILWVIIASVVLWLPPHLTPNIFRNNRQLFICSSILFGIVISVLAFLLPIVNAVFLITFSIPIVIVILRETQSSNNIRFKKLGKRTTVLWLLGIACWINDRVFCDMWTSMFNFQYFHAVFHILIFHSAYQACVLCAFYHASHTLAHKEPSLVYWPWNSFEYGVPCIAFKAASSNYKVNKYRQL
ncbi:alkaline ceramidase [Chamberlinius hualienensis]